MDKERILVQLADAWAITPLREDELTSADISDALKKAGSVHSREYVSRKLKDLRDAGLIDWREARVIGGGRSYAYSPVEGKSWEDVLQYIKVN